MSAIIRLVGTLVLLLAATVAQAQNEVPTDRALEALVKGSLLTLNDANVTGNYSVLHAKLSRPFREQFSIEKFRAAFKQFRVENTDYDIIAAMQPTYDPKPVIDEEGKLVVKGVNVARKHQKARRAGRGAAQTGIIEVEMPIW